MSKAHRRGADLERLAAKALGSRRVLRAIGESAGDVELARLPSGLEVSAECKKRRKGIALVTKALEQARRYHPTAIPLAVIAAFGKQPIVALSLSDFRRLVGLAPSDAPEQPSLFARPV